MFLAAILLPTVLQAHNGFSANCGKVDNSDGKQGGGWQEVKKEANNSTRQWALKVLNYTLTFFCSPADSHVLLAD